MKWTLKGSPNLEHRKARGQSEGIDVCKSKVIGYCPERRTGNIPKEERHIMIGQQRSSAEEEQNWQYAELQCEIGS